MECNGLSRNIKLTIYKFNNKRWPYKLTKLKVSDNTLWHTAKALTKRSSNATPSLHGPNGVSFSDLEKANVLAQQSVLVHHSTELLVNKKDTLVKKIIRLMKQKPSDLKFITLNSSKKIYNIIKKTNSTKAPGPDYRTYRTLYSKTC